MAQSNATIQALLDNNHKFVETYKVPPMMTQMRGMAKSAGGGTSILTCVDPRCVPEQFFGPLPGVAVLRNAGGHATDDVVNSLTVLRALVDLKMVFVVHHTDCGMTHMTDEEIRREAKERTPAATPEIESATYGCWTPSEFEQSIKDDVRVLQKSEVLKGVNIFGFQLVTETGIVTKIDA